MLKLGRVKSLFYVSWRCCCGGGRSSSWKAIILSRNSGVGDTIRKSRDENLGKDHINPPLNIMPA